MPAYEYLCTACDETFEVRRSMTDTNADVACPSGHRDVRRRFSVFASVGAASASSSAAAAAPMGGGGGCCGGGCGCR